MAGTSLRVRVHSWPVLAVLAAILPGSVAGAAEPQDAKPRKAGVGMEEVVVTARRRPEYLQETPVSITAFTSDDLERENVSRVEELGFFIPNLQYNSAGGTTDSQKIQIRSIGVSDPIETNDPGVGTYVDDVYVARAQGALMPVLDIARIEVLRGPQGTLYGRNTVGGAVKIVTQAPTNELEGSAKIRIGNYNDLETRGMLNVPLRSEVAAMRIGFATATRDGYTKNQLNGQDTDDRKLLAYRAQLLLNPAENVSVRLIGDQTKAHTAARGAQCRYRADSISASDPNGLIVIENPLFGFDTACNRSRRNDDLDYESPIKSKSNTDTWASTGIVEYENPLFTAKSITAWRRQKTTFNYDFSYTSVNLGNVIQDPDQQDELSQEFNFTGTALADKLNWTTGLYTFRERGVPGRQQSFIAYNLCSTFNLQSACNLSFTSNLGISTQAHAVYGQATYALTDKLRFTAGLRRSVEHKHFTYDTYNFLNNNMDPDPALTFNLKAGARYNSWTPMANLAYDITPQVMVYFGYARGFKSGGFNGRPNGSLAITLEPYEQENLHDIETGFKSVLLNDRLLLNVNVFRGVYDDIQSSVIAVDPNTNRLATSVKNNALAILSGAEIEAKAYPLPQFELSMGLGITDLHFVRTEPNGLIISPITGMQIDTHDLRPNNTPPFEANYGVAYTFTLQGLGDMTVRANWFHQGRISHGPNSDTNNEKKVGLLSSRISLVLRDGTEISAFGENLTDQRYLNDGINFEDGFAASLGFYGPPRMFGMEVRRPF